MHTMDELDKKLILALQDDCRNLQEIANQLNEPISTLHYRVRRLEKAGVIKGYSTIIDPEKTGLIFNGFVHIMVEHGPRFEDIGEQIAEFPGVKRLYWAFGEVDYLAFVRARSQEEFNGIIRRIMNLDGVERTNTNIVANVIKESIHISV